MELSYWEKEGIQNTNQIVIVGSGIVGLSTAIYIKQMVPNKQVLVIERAGMPLGASTKNAGFACFGSISEVLDDLQVMNEEEVIHLIRQRFTGLQRLQSLVEMDNINYIPSGGYEIFTDSNKEEYERCISKIDYCNQLAEEAIEKENVFQLQNENFGINTHQKLIYNSLEGQLNPYLLVQALTRNAVSTGVKIMYDISAEEIDFHNHLINTSSGLAIPFQKLAICTNGFATRLLPELEVYPARNQVMMTTPIQDLQLRGCYHYHQGYVYFRNYGSRVLLGGARHLNKDGETTMDFGTTEEIKSFLLQLLKEYIVPGQQVEVEHWWSGIMGIGPNKSPLVSRHRDDVFIGVRLGGMGVALGSHIGYQLAKIIIE